MFPFIALVSLAAVAMGMLNALGAFALPQSASSAFNVVSIVVGLATAWALAPAYMQALWRPGSSAMSPWVAAGAGPAMMGMAVGTLAGGAAQLGVQLPALYRAGFRWRPKKFWQDADVAEVLRLMGPTAIGAAAVQLNVLCNANVASRLGEGPISWLAYAFRLLQFPIGVFGVAVMSASLPALSRLGGQRSMQARQQFGQTLGQALQMVLFLCLPAAAALWLLGQQMVAMMFEHGRFGAADSLATGRALAAYSLGLPAYAALKVVQPAFVACGQARWPMWVALGGVVLGLCSNLVGIWALGLGYLSLALTTSMVAWMSTTLLLCSLGRAGQALPWGQLWPQVWRMAVATLAASVPMAAAAWRAGQGGGGAAAAAVVLAWALPAAAAVYWASALWLRVEVAADVWRVLRRRLSPRRRAR